jgi:hypothetical protein
MTDQSGTDHDELDRMPGSNRDVDVDGERDVVDDEFEDAMPSRLDASFEVPIPDAIDQRREVSLDTDGYEA